ncbi:glycosyltransferase family 4 protein [Alteromonas pelagimontana]|uniref:Glycosyltransferase family 4 protein n=1 Tax=Alteromonas pelagimontana TaxID=1858656 RepID=A0A6M4MAK0_9ALTE|nr:glycosyltransferase family 4 protein [Alteromonas pelagimontana]QJR80192.1 glycosyltransferase family 4 protein [Alteromonas pelagimontana]
MKLCAVGLRGIPNVMGGIESHCQQLYPRLVKAGMDVTVICRSPYVDTSVKEYKGVKLRSVWTIKHKFAETFLHTFLAIFYARFVIKPDILHIHGIGPALFTPLAKILGMQVMVTHHGADYDRQKWNTFAKSMLRLGESMAIKFADRAIVVGRSLTQRLKETFSKRANRILFVPNGTMADMDDNMSRDKLPKDLTLEAEKYILAVGRLVPEKGFHDLVKAYQNSSTPLKLVIVGNADHEDDYSRKLMAQRNENIIFAGRRQGDELNALYKFARVFCLPSYHEGLPIVALEAISAGTDVIISDIVPNADIGLPADCYFAVGNVEALTQKINQVEALNLKINKETFLNKFNWDTIALDTHQIAKELVVGGPAQRQTVN